MAQHPFLISFCSIGLRDKPLGEALDIIARAGFRGVEIWWAHLEKLSADEQRALAAQCKKLGLTATVISPYFYFTRGQEWRERSLQTAREVLAAAAFFGTKKVRTFVDSGPDGLASAKATEADWAGARDGLRELCDLDSTVEFVVETHENTLADTLPTCERLLREVDRPNLKLNFQVGEDFLERGFMKCLEILYPHVSHLHWDQITQDGKPTYLEEPGKIDFAELMGWLAARGYHGTASVEYCWKDVPVERVETAARFLDGVAAKLAR